MKNKANGPCDRLLTEKLQELTIQSVNEITHWFDKRFRGERRAQAAWTISTFGFPQETDAKLGKGIRGVRAILL